MTSHTYACTHSHSRTCKTTHTHTHTHTHARTHAHTHNSNSNAPLLQPWCVSAAAAAAEDGSGARTGGDKCAVDSSHYGALQRINWRYIWLGAILAIWRMAAVPSYCSYSESLVKKNTLHIRDLFWRGGKEFWIDFVLWEEWRQLLSIVFHLCCGKWYLLFREACVLVAV